MDIWRSLLTGPHPVEHVIIITMYRVEGTDRPSKSLLAGTDIHVKSFPESGVAEFIQACLPTTVDSLSTLASFLYAETSGSPLYLRSLMVSLVGPVIFFDYDLLLWRFDPLALQTQLSDAGVDVYLDKVQRGLPVEARRVLQLLACLPVGGCRIELLAQLLGEEVDTSLVAAQNVGTIIVNGDHVRFSHDRPRVSFEPEPSLTDRAQHTSRYRRVKRPRYINVYPIFSPTRVA
jgi:predicted ATPase